MLNRRIQVPLPAHHILLRGKVILMKHYFQQNAEKRLAKTQFSLNA